MSEAMAWSLVAIGLIACLAMGYRLLRLGRHATREGAILRRLRDELEARQRDGGLLRAGLEGAGEGLILIDAEGHLAAWNSQATLLTGHRSSYARGRLLESILPAEKLENLRGSMSEGEDVAGESEFECELPNALLDTAEERALVVRVRALGDLGYLVRIEDQRRLRRLESLRREFVANVSHELKTPLAAIIGFVETLLDDPDLPDEMRLRFLERIRRQSRRLNSLVGDLLTLSRLDDATGAETGASDLSAVLRELERDLTPLAELSGIDLDFEGPEEPIEVRGERETLRQVVGNLVDNAIKYGPEGSTVFVRVEPSDDQVLIEVEDTGIGLRPEDQERVFERFYRVDQARSRELGGTGLGLSIVKNTVRRLGGDVGVRSELAQGSTFWVTFPKT